MEEKYINKILNFSDENINNAEELIINKEQAKKIVKELQEDYIPKAVIKLIIAELKEYKVSLLKKDYAKEQKELTSQNVLVCSAIRDIATTGKIQILEELLKKGEQNG